MRTLCSLTAVAAVLWVPGITSAQVSTDGTLGSAAQTLIGPDYSVTALLGQTSGNNLFHSFHDFNVNTGESLTFSGPASIQHIIVRVTGGNTTNLDGLLRTTIPGADLTLLDRDGINMGPYMTLDVSGDLAFTTVDALVFADGNEFSASFMIGETLSAANAAGLRSAGANGAIIVTGPLLFAPGNIALVGNGVGIASATLDTISGGVVSLASVNSAGTFSFADGVITMITEPFNTFNDLGFSGTASIGGNLRTFSRSFNANAVQVFVNSFELTCSTAFDLTNSTISANQFERSCATGNIVNSTISVDGVEVFPVTCGDAVVGLDEDCDNGAANSNDPDASCRTDCTPLRCGDGIVDTGEFCDAGDLNSNEPDAACRTDCMPLRCGDGIVDADEECDAGAANSDEPDAACRVDCSPQSCGDGVIDSDEGCDLGDANSDEPDAACRLDCMPLRCGDGVTDPGEECDLGGANSNDPDAACRLDCTPLRCGDGIVDADEQCDDDSATCVACESVVDAPDEGETEGGGCTANPRSPSPSPIPLALLMGMTWMACRRSRQRRAPRS